jgi:hypothetical protein
MRRKEKKRKEELKRSEQKISTVRRSDGFFRFPAPAKTAALADSQYWGK